MGKSPHPDAAALRSGQPHAHIGPIRPPLKVDSSIERVVWMVDDDRSFSDLSEAVALDTDIEVVNLSTDELLERRRPTLPDGSNR